MLSDAQIVAAMRKLGLSQTDFVVTSAEKLAEIKLRAKKAYRAAVVELHPDRTRGDRDKELQLVALNEVMAEVRNLQAPLVKRKRKLTFCVRK
jgi:hypothetical protein